MGPVHGKMPEKRNQMRCEFHLGVSVGKPTPSKGACITYPRIFHGLIVVYNDISNCCGIVMCSVKESFPNNALTSNVVHVRA